MCRPALCRTRSQARLGGPRGTLPLPSSPGDHVLTGCCSGFASFPLHTDVIPSSCLMLVNLVVHLPPILHPEAACIICRGQASLDLLRPRGENGVWGGLADPLLPARTASSKVILLGIWLAGCRRYPSGLCLFLLCWQSPTFSVASWPALVWAPGQRQPFAVPCRDHPPDEGGL